MELAQQSKNLFICDIAALTAHAGRSATFSPATYTNTGIVFDIDFWPSVVKNVADIILAISGKFKKAVVLDLDNTLWGGIIGDDGIEGIQIGDLGIGRAFTELQMWLKQLKERGIILAVCSKNYEHIAMEAFEKHPDMILRPDDIAVFVANWENKVDNIRYIQTVLNIGMDSIVYLDDNPFERNMVRQELPALTIPELPEDPAEYLLYLQTLNLFETASVTEEDAGRTKQYQEEAKRVSLQKAYANEDEFLQSLEMESPVTPFNKFNTPRVAQLSQRSNQFNLRTVRYTEKDIENIAEDNSYVTFAFNLKDKFGDYGMISAVILKIEGDMAFIDTWFMSCRVLKRGMENFVLNTIAQAAKDRGCTKLAGEYIPTPKNELVKDHYAKLGFTQVGDKWELDLNTFENHNVYINIKEHATN
jgi:FkbH-like protein